jgi:hypothetical protein
MIIGLTGKREAGKSTFAKVAIQDFDFKGIHAFGPGKAMLMAYYEYMGIDRSTAWEMVHGSQKDVVLGNMPEPDKDSRFFMEEFGYFMGVKMGPKWTAMVELAKVEREFPGSHKILESIVYELPIVKELDDIVIIGVERPGHTGPEGTHTDAYVADIKPLITIINEDLMNYKHKCRLLIEVLINNPGNYGIIPRIFGEVF